VKGRRKHIPKILGGGCRIEIVEALAWRPRQTVNEIRSGLNLSYMGIKSQCLALERAGYLKSRLRRRLRGRPEVVYALTPKGHRLLPQSGPELSLDLLRQSTVLFGAQAPGKLLFLYFQERAQSYLGELAGLTGWEMVERFLELRRRDGHYSSISSDGCLEEGHDPLAAIRKQYPAIDQFEEKMLGQVLSGEVKRLESERGERRFLLPESVRSYVVTAEPDPEAFQSQEVGDEGPAATSELPNRGQSESVDPIPVDAEPQHPNRDDLDEAPVDQIHTEVPDQQEEKESQRGFGPDGQMMMFN